MKWEKGKRDRKGEGKGRKRRKERKRKGGGNERKDPTKFGNNSTQTL